MHGNIGKYPENFKINPRELKLLLTTLDRKTMGMLTTNEELDC